MEPYVIPIFTDEWWRNNIVTFLIIGFLLFIGNKLSEKNYYFNFIIGSFLILRLPWNQYYQYQIGQYNLEWSLPLQMCSFSSFFSGLILVLHGLKDKIMQAYSEVQASNMSKACKTKDEAIETVKVRSKEQGVKCHYEKVGKYYIVYRSADRKVMKSINYFKPNLKLLF